MVALIAFILLMAVPAASRDAGRATVDMFLARLTQLLSPLSESPLRTRFSGDEVVFESVGLRVPAGELSLAGRLRVDPSTGGFAGEIERLRVNHRFELTHAARIHGAPDGMISVEGLELSGPSGEVVLEGTLDPAGRLSASARLRGADLYALGLLFTEHPPASGRATADAAVDGTWAAAILRLAGRLDPGSGSPPVEGLSVQALWASGDLTVTRCEGRLGGSPFRAAGRVHHLAPALENARFELALTGEHLLLVRTEDMLLRGDVDLRLLGPFTRPELSGRVVLTEGRYEGGWRQQNVGGLLTRPSGGDPRRLELFALRLSPWRDAVLDVEVGAREPLRVVTPAVRIAARLDMRLTGTGASPVPIGRVDFEPGVLALPGGRLEVGSGTLRFQPPDPTRPTIEVIGSGRMQGYEVGLAAEGPFDEPRVTLSSYPVLGHEELLLLVLTGRNPRAVRPADAERSRNFDVAVALGKDMLSRMGGEDRSAETTPSVVERFQMEVGRNVTRTGDETVYVLFRVADGVVRSGDTLYLTGERDVWGYYNGGVRIAFRFP
jgi:hypothetical protein